jgi:transcriptional regulator of nitric oxide reductase
MYLPAAARLGVLQGMVAGLQFANVQMRLLKTRVVAGDAVTLAALLAAEANFAGYVPSLLQNIGTPSVSPGVVSSVSVEGHFFPSSSAGTGNILGYFLCNIAATQLYGAEDYGATPISTPGTEPLYQTLLYQIGPP